jgi:hypothetical protein
MKKRTFLTILVSLLLVGCASVQPKLSGIGFVLKSTDFGDPCTNDPGDFPVIYDNASSNSVDVSFQIFNTGGSNIFVVGTGFVIPPLGPNQRPRVIRLTVAPGDTIKLHGQAGDCAWKAIIWPH